MDLKLIYKYIYKPIFENVAIWKKYIKIVYIYIFFSYHKVSLFDELRKDVFVRYIFSDLKGFQKQVFTYIYGAERNAVV